MYVWKRFMLQKEFWVSRVDNNANKLLKRSQTLLGVNEFQVVNFVSALTSSNVIKKDCCNTIHRG